LLVWHCAPHPAAVATRAARSRRARPLRVQPLSEGWAGSDRAAGVSLLYGEWPVRQSANADTRGKARMGEVNW